MTRRRKRVSFKVVSCKGGRCPTCRGPHTFPPRPYPVPVVILAFGFERKSSRNAVCHSEINKMSKIRPSKIPFSVFHSCSFHHRLLLLVVGRAVSTIHPGRSFRGRPRLTLSRPGPIMNTFKNWKLLGAHKWEKISETSLIIFVKSFWIFPRTKHIKILVKSIRLWMRERRVGRKEGRKEGGKKNKEKSKWDIQNGFSFVVFIPT